MPLSKWQGNPLRIAERCRFAEEQAFGVPCGVLDQLAICSALPKHAMLIDFSTMAVAQVPMPDDLDVWIFDTGVVRRLASSPYALRRSQCEAASAMVGPLGQCAIGDIAGIRDTVLMKRARHVVTECDRGRSFASAMEQGDLSEAGRVITASHRSLSSDFEVSTPEVDDLVDRVLGVEGILGARMTGGGFGGCLVAIARAAAAVLDHLGSINLRYWKVAPSAGASVELI